jgi:hypothetical protein
MMRPSVFIGSSSEGLEFARAIRSLLSPDAEVTLWNEGLFAVGSTLIDSLVDYLPRLDFAILVLTPDDLSISRDTESFSPRDNVVFELGLFMGYLGRSRTIMVHEDGSKIKIPSDLSGVIRATYRWPREDSNQKAAVGVACDSIREVIRGLGLREEKLVRTVRAVESEQARQRREIDSLAFMIAHFLPQFELEILQKLASGEAFPYEMHGGFERELRHLWEVSFITKSHPHPFKIGEMPRSGNLRTYFAVTEQGRLYLELRAGTGALNPGVAADGCGP